MGVDEYFLLPGTLEYTLNSDEKWKKGTRWVKKVHYYLKYDDPEVIDTITIRDSLHYPEYHELELLYNGKKIEYAAISSYNPNCWLATIKKRRIND